MKFGKFEALKKIGAGGMGVVWEVRHPSREGRFAAKLSMHPRATLPEYRQRFEREVRAMARLRHPNVVRVFDYGVYLGPPGSDAPRRGTPWMVMEFAPGGELKSDHVDSWESLRDALVALLSGLAHSHSRGLIHRDIKPQNLLWVERRGLLVPAVADFGISHALDRQRPSSVDHFTGRSEEEATGTPKYMAPEQFMGKWRDYGPWTDLYSTGILAFVLATGTSPFEGGNLYQFAAKHMREPLPQLEPLFDVPETFQSWVKWLAAKEPGDRPQTAQEAIDRLIGVEPTSVPSWSNVEPDDEPGRAPVGLGLFGLQRTYLIGREAERDRLWSALGEVVTSNEPIAVQLVGASGLGKSRLADWLSELAVERAISRTVFRAHFSSDRPDTAGLAWMLAQHYRCAGLESEQLDERLAAILPESWDDEARMAMKQVLSQAESVASDITSPTVKQSMTVEMSKRAITAAASRGPVVVHLDDIDLDPTSSGKNLLQQLTGDPTVGPVLVVATSQAGGAEAIEIGPLPKDTFRRLLRDELGLPVDISDVVERLADGSPQFALQLIELWLERGELTDTVDGLALDAVDVPATLDAIWAGRVEQLAEGLSDEGRMVLAAAGVLGQPIEPTEWLATASELGVDIESSVFGDVAGAMVEVGVAKWDDTDRMLLIHATIADLLAAVDGDELRRKAHGSAARALSSLYSPNEPGLALRVAEHFRKGGNPQLALFALQPALDAALDIVDSGEIGQVAEAILDTYDDLGVAEDAPDRAVARAFRSIEWITARRDDDRERGGQWLDDAMEVAQSADAERRAKIEGVYGWAAIARGEREAAAELLERLVDDDAVSPRTRTLGRVFLTHIYTYLHDGDAVRRHATKVLQEARPLAWKLRSREALIHVALAARDAETAKQHAFPALILARQLKRLHLQVHIENLAGFIADLDGDFEQAQAHHERAERLSGIVQPQSGVRLMAREYRARALVHQEKWTEAFDLLWGLADEVDAGRAPGVHPWDALLAAAVALDDARAEERATPRAFDVAANALHVRSIAAALRGMRAAGRDDDAAVLEKRARAVFEAAAGVQADDLAQL